MPDLHLRLLGDFSLLYNDQQVTSLNTSRLQSLLTYLVLHRDAPQQRQHLAFLFWPDTTEAQARNNLRQLLYQLRQALYGSGLDPIWEGYQCEETRAIRKERNLDRASSPSKVSSKDITNVNSRGDFIRCLFCDRQEEHAVAPWTTQ